jgi:hypothetical protein
MENVMTLVTTDRSVIQFDRHNLKSHVAESSGRYAGIHFGPHGTESTDGKRMLRVPYPSPEVGVTIPDGMATDHPTPETIPHGAYVVDAKAAAKFAGSLPKGRDRFAGIGVVALNGTVEMATPDGKSRAEPARWVSDRSTGFPEMAIVTPKPEEIVGETPWFDASLLGDLLIKIGEVLAGRDIGVAQAVRIKFTGPHTPAVVECAHDPNLIAVVMPVRTAKYY